MYPDDTAVWSRVSDLVADRLGLHFPPERLDDLRRGLAAAAADSGGGDARAYAGQLLANGLDASQLPALARHLTIGETYFMRGDETFAALRAQVLPALVRARAGQKRLRLWSAACATGEEAYSLAIVLRELLPDIEDWDVRILATDVNPQFLQRAREGVYGKWSFRGTSAEFRARWFRRTRERRYALAPEIARMVTFAPVNLVEAALPPMVAGEPVDLILCRNVLMYFETARAAAVAAKLRKALAPDGWLVVAPCEVSQGLSRGLEPVRFEGAILYRRQADASALPAVPAAASPLAPPLGRPAAAAVPPHHIPALRSPSRRPRTGRAATAAAARASDTPALATRARSLADQGRLPEALACCDEWLESDKLDAGAHYLRAMILTELDRPGEARTALQRCIYLDPDAPMGSFSLGNLERRLGRRELAARHYRHALYLLQRHPRGRMLGHADGVSAEQLGVLLADLIGQEQCA